jgi:cytochrome c
MKEHNLMSSFEINKIMGSIFSVVLLILIIKNLGSMLYPNKDVYHNNSDEKNNVAEINTETPENDNSNIVILDIDERLKTANIYKGKLYSKKCVVCHSFELNGPNKIGPNLYNIYLRKIASIETFKYSKSLNNIQEEWDSNNLDNFLLNPKKWAPKTKMSFVGIKNDKDRANIIKYLQSLN